jgi:transcriptional regulator with XRE-family HTH domain
MRLSTKRSQTEYAALCSVSLRVLRQVESGKLNLQTETIEKLLRPFGYRIGVVRDGD